MNNSINTKHTILLDSGNTRLKIAILDNNNGEISQFFAFEHTKLSISKIKNCFNQTINVGSIIGANVAGTSNETYINNIFKDLFKLEPNWVKVEKFQSGVYNHYLNTQQLGVDRWVSMIGLSKLISNSNQPSILANFGTATTIDTLVPKQLMIKSSNIKAKWHFIGGTILPGPTLMAESLATNTANLPKATGATQKFPIETYQAISSGIAGAQAGAVIRQWQAALDLFAAPPLLYISGGGASIITQELKSALNQAQGLNSIQAFEPQILNAPIMDGLAVIASSYQT